ncbi:uncharacterized protein LOC124436671 [Xenia sp. Carnegie-2017]|uniref:uncharacterized protein LOC124436671 n=1 Tax=Xenia sp. Carnegie-2017 TaxID=2897299 RepID=UPI001F04F4C7|nr:uncharacterized protein LOC124436671 [Xenia sp. Carnegie-2017]
MEEDVNEMFEQILRDSSKDDEIITDVEDLEQEVLDFIIDNVDIGKVLEETSQDAPEMDFNIMTEESCVEYFDAIAQQTKMPISIVSSQTLARQVMNVVNTKINESAGEISPLLHPTVKERVKTLLSFIKQFKMKRQNYFDSLHFIHNLSRKEIPLELMFLLDETSVVNFQTCFASWLADEEWLADFQSSVVSLCCHGDKEDVNVRRRILEVVTSNLLRLSYHGESNEITEQVKKSSRKILSNIIRLLEKQIETFKNDEKIEQWWICFLELVRKCNEIPRETRHDFLQEVLTDWVMGSNTSTLENAFISQHKWTFELLLSSIKTNFAQFVMALQDNEIIQTIDHAVEASKSDFINMNIVSS